MNQKNIKNHGEYLKIKKVKKKNTTKQSYKPLPGTPNIGHEQV